MRSVSIIVILLSLSGGLAGQSFGIKGGLNFMDMELDEIPNHVSYDSWENYERGVGYHAGIFARLGDGFLYLQPELIYSNLHQKITASGANPTQVEFNYSRLDGPVLVGFKVGPISLLGGPVGSIHLGEETPRFESALQQATWGFQVGGALLLKSWQLSLRYEAPLSSTGRTIRVGEERFRTDARPNQVIVSLGVELF